MTAVLYCIVGGGVGENGKDGEGSTVMNVRVMNAVLLLVWVRM
jgi:hypothetical protein